jgi:CHAT domain-containing protein
MTDLAQASDEAVNVAHALAVTPLVGGAANIKAVLEGFRNACIVHLAAHASFDADHPLGSVLHLADGDLSARDLVGSWSTSELVVLSACESGTGSAILGGEVLGLAIELLRSGVQGVIASIWPVDDAATAYLMQQFYTALANGLSTPRALAKAMTDTKAQSGWSRPYYWAGFVLVRRGWGN